MTFEGLLSVTIVILSVQRSIFIVPRGNGSGMKNDV